MSAMDHGPANRRWAGLGINFLMVVVSCVLALLLAELAVRVAGIGSDQLLRPDPLLGVRLIASKTGLSQGSCYKAHASINDDGWRSGQVSLVKPDGVYRVLVLGDSFMAGLQVQDDEIFASAMERQLNRATAGRRIEVINFGVPSWGTDQEYLALREFGLSLKPDLVLLAFYAQNDVDGNYSALRSATNVYPKPYFDVRDGQLVELPYSDPTPAIVRIARQVVAPFRLYPLIRDALIEIPFAHRLLYNLGIVGVVPVEKRAASPATAAQWNWPDRWRRQLGVYRRDYSNERQHAWAITEGLLSKLRSEVTKGGAELLMMGVSSPIDVMPPSLRKGLVVEGEADTLDVDKPARLLKQIAQRHNIDLVSLLPGFRQRIGNSEAEFEKYYLHCDGHWTVAGHRLAAELVAPQIAARVASKGQ